MNKKLNPINEIINNTTKEYRPKNDDIFSVLFKTAYDGYLVTYSANIPIESIRLFDKNFIKNAYKLDSNQVESSINSQEEWIECEDGNPLWVYPKDGVFVLSDDYFLYEAYRRLGYDFLPCLVLGNPFATGVEDIVGPLDRSDVRESILVSLKARQ